MKPVLLKTGYAYIFLLILVSINFSAASQNLVVVQDTSSKLVNCVPSKLTDACVTIVTNKSLELFFSSTTDTIINIVSKTEVGAYMEYSLNLPTDDLKYLDRILRIRCQLFPDDVEIELVLEPKESLRFYVYIPECYNVYLKNGADLFMQSSYNEAKEEYKKARNCFDAPADGEIAVRMSIIDSILLWRKMADASFSLLDYKEARDCYNKIASYNIQDDYAINRSKESTQKYNQYCYECFSKAEVFFNTNEHKQAKSLYYKVISQNCQQQSEATLRIKEMIADSIKRLDRSTVFTYEMANNIPFGFSIGGYKSKKGGGYFTLKTNPDFFNMLRSKYEKAIRPEINASAGGNFRPVKNKYAPVWINIGIGYTLLGAYYYDAAGEKELYKGGEIPDTFDSSPALYHAISPEIGLLGKIPLGQTAKVGIALRYTFQYRFALDADTQDYIKPVAHGFGLGLCF